jgi:outer membrane protein OmpA-like peptidoglycan-associated protein
MKKAIIFSAIIIQIALSWANAHLISKAIAPARIISIGKGEREFIASNDSEQGKAKNRRVELKIIE